MNLTPLDIRKKEFKKVMRGCDPAEVEAFLELLSEEFELFQFELDKQLKEIEQLTEKNQNLEQSPKPDSVEDKSEIFTKKEAGIIIKEAEVKSLEIIEIAKSEANRLKEEIFVLKTQKNSFIKRLKHLFASQIELIDVLEIEDVDMTEYKTLSNQIDKPKISDKPSAPLNSGADRKIDIMLDDIEEKTEAIKRSVNIDDELPFIKKKAREILDDEAKDTLNTDDNSKEIQPKAKDTFDHFINQIGEGDES